MTMSDVWQRNAKFANETASLQSRLQERMNEVRTEFKAINEAVQTMEESILEFYSVLDSANVIVRMTREEAEKKKTVVRDNEKRIPKIVSNFDLAYSKWLDAMDAHVVSRANEKSKIVAKSGSGPGKQPRHTAQVAYKRRLDSGPNDNSKKKKSAKNTSVKTIVGDHDRLRLQMKENEEEGNDGDTAAKNKSSSANHIRFDADSLNSEQFVDNDDEISEELTDETTSENDDAISYLSDDLDPVVGLPYESEVAYFDSLSIERMNELDRLAKAMREDPSVGTDDWEVLQHVNMQHLEDNLYLACYKEQGLEEVSVQLIQADKYDRWKKNNSATKVDTSKGQWRYTVLRTYYLDEDKPIENCRWRYEIHQYYQEKKKWSKGYYSFDNRLFRSHEPATKRELLTDWSEKLTMLKGHSFLFGPFSWEDENEFRIPEEIWIKAIPIVIATKTHLGSLFWQGFSDRVLLVAGCKLEDIEKNKKMAPKEVIKSGGDVLPVLYTDMEPARQKLLVRCFRSSNERFVTCPRVWKEKPIPGRQKKGSKVAAWMDVLSPKQISERQSPKKFSAKKR